MTAPNIVLLIFDDMIFTQLQRMPQLMKLAQSGVNFLNAFANTPLCQPARMTLLTGQYSHNHGLIDNSLTGYPIDHATMLAARLKAAGYQTHQVGKYMNSWAIGNAIPPSWDDWHQTDPMEYFGYSINDNGVTTTPSAYHTDLVSTRALAAVAGASQPFFMQVAYKAPHHDLPSSDFLNANPHPNYAGVTPGTVGAPRNPNFNVPMGTPPAYMNHAPMDSTKVAAVDAFWRGQIEMLYSVDRSVQAIVAALSGLPNTIIIATSDHGFMHGEGMDPAGKMVPYLPSMHIPLIIAGPSNLVAQGAACSQLVSQADITATIYALSGATSTRALDGVSLAPLLLNPNGPAVRSNLLIEFVGDGTNGTGWFVTVPVWRSILSAKYLYTAYATGELELFDIVFDPFQLANLAGVPAYAATQSSMAAKLAAVQACVGGACVI